MRSSVLETIPDGTAGLRVKLARLRDLVDVARADPTFRDLALRVVGDVREKDTRGELAAVSRFVRRLRYTRDPYGVELFHDPRLLAAALAGVDGGETIPAGDCDDAAALGAALVESLGYPSRFVVGGFLRGDDDPTWSHIWYEAMDPRRGEWVTIDDTAKDRPAGWSPAAHFGIVAHFPPNPTNEAMPHPYATGQAMLDRRTLPVELGGLGFSIGKSIKRAARSVSRGAKTVAKKAKQVGKAAVKAAVSPAKALKDPRKLLSDPMALAPSMVMEVAKSGAMGSAVASAATTAEPVLNAAAVQAARGMLSTATGGASEMVLQTAERVLGSRAGGASSLLPGGQEIPGGQEPPPEDPKPSSGISTMTVVAIGAAAIVGFFLLRGRR